MERDPEHPRERAETDGGHEEEREDERIDAPEHVEEPPGRVVERHRGRDVPCRQDAKGQGEQRRSGGSERGHRHGLGRAPEQHGQLVGGGRPRLDRPRGHPWEPRGELPDVHLGQVPAHGVERRQSHDRQDEPDAGRREPTKSRLRVTVTGGGDR